MSNNIYLDWAEFKALIDSKVLNIQFIEFSHAYHMMAFDGPFRVDCKMFKKASADLTDFETNYKPSGNKTFTDADGSQLFRQKAAKKGWTFGLVPIEVETSKLTGVSSKLVDNTNRSGISVKLYNASDVLITDAADEGTCVRTVIEFEPTYDYELIGGRCQQMAKPANDVHIWVIAVPDIAAPNGSKEMVGGVNLCYIDPTDKVDANGRAAKFMTYDATYHTNKLQFTFRHTAGVNHKALLTLEMFRA